MCRESASVVMQDISSDQQQSGRSQESATLRRDWQSALAGRARVALLAGEPGIGKTWLLNAQAAEADAAGALTLRGAAFQAEGMPPYLPFLEALGRHLRAL